MYLNVFLGGCCVFLSLHQNAGCTTFHRQKGVFREKKAHFFGNKTVNHRSGANLKIRVFCKILLQISYFFKLFSTKNAENYYFD